MNKTFRAEVRRALANDALQEALDRNAERRRAGREAAFATLPDSRSVLQTAAEIRRRSVADLEELVELFSRRGRERGVCVHLAADSPTACLAVAGILRAGGARRVVKAKSMVTEEIGLNAALSPEFDVVETDLGEFIVQLRGERPTHLTTPALHLRRQEVGRTFEEHLGLPYTTDVTRMTAAARGELRRRFLEADAGITGANFGVAATGTLCLVTNEGNGRMVTALPPIHIAVMGIERIVRNVDELNVMLDVLPRAATGQGRTSYVSLLGGPRGGEDPDGPSERHIVLVDNGRRRMGGSEFGEALACIRCGACLNACPVYQEIGGHAYGSVYPGPIGSVVSPWLFGREAFLHLARASTLCGACRDVCPVGIDLPRLLVRSRALPEGRSAAPGGTRLGARLFAWVVGSPARYRTAQRLASVGTRLLSRRGSWIRRLPSPASGWTRRRDFPPFAARPFRNRWGRRALEDSGQIGAVRARQTLGVAGERPRPSFDLAQRFVEGVRAAGGEVIPCSAQGAGDAVHEALRALGVRRVLAWGRGQPALDGVLDRLSQSGVEVVVPALPVDRAERRNRLAEVAGFEVGLTGASAGLADAGSLVLTGGTRRSQIPSLLPPVHLAVLESSDLYPSLGDWFVAGGDRRLEGAENVVVITGPSRTADIEMTLTIGVHGPRRVVVFLVGPEPTTLPPPILRA